MIERVVDSSVQLAILRGERFDLVDPNIILGAVMSTVNFEETLSKSIEFRLDLNAVNRQLGMLNRVEPFTVAQARVAASLRARTRLQGMGLGDRACVALGIQLGADVYTTEKKWTEVDLGCRILLVRTPPPSNGPRLRTIGPL